MLNRNQGYVLSGREAVKMEVSREGFTKHWRSSVSSLVTSAFAFVVLFAIKITSSMRSMENSPPAHLLSAWPIRVMEMAVNDENTQ